MERYDMDRYDIFKTLKESVIKNNVDEFKKIFIKYNDIAILKCQDLFFDCLKYNNKNIAKFLVNYLKPNEHTLIFMCKDISLLKWLLVNNIGTETNLMLGRQTNEKNVLMMLGVGIDNYAIIRSMNMRKQLKKLIY